MAGIYDVTLATLRQVGRIAGPALGGRIAEAERAGPIPARARAPLYRLHVSDDERSALLDALRKALIAHGFEEGGVMRPIGHVYQGIIAIFTLDNAAAA